MRIVIAGGSGFLGRPLADACRSDGHTVAILTRGRPSGSDEIQWTPDGTAGAWSDALHGADAVINLSGASIAGARWTSTRKTLLRESRLRATRSLVDAMARQSTPPGVFVSGSAVGYYGPHRSEPVSEDTPKGTDFLAELAASWEEAALPAARFGARVILLRTGLALAPDGGILGRMLLPFRFGAGGRLGSGDQFVPWIHVSDWIDLVRWVLVTPSIEGALNLTAPSPVTNAEFGATLARLLHRPFVAHVPAFVLRVALGELADALLTGQRAHPERALAGGFRFRWPTLEPALRDLLRLSGAGR
jgi:uncharacterized protein (TIGR01777 family)